MSEDEERELTSEELERLRILQARSCEEAEKKLTPLELDALRCKQEDHLINHIIDLVLNDGKRLPKTYQKPIVQAAYLRIMRLIRDDGLQDEEVSREEEAKMRELRKLGSSFEDVAFIMRRSSATVHKHLNAIPMSPNVAKMLGVE